MDSFIQARWFYSQRTQPIKRIYIHSMEAPEKGDTAEAIARYFQRGDRKASAHYCIDSNSIVGCVRDQGVAFHMAGDNSASLGFEHAGYARQTRADWLDAYSQYMLNHSARLAAEKLTAYSIPLVKLSPSDLLLDKKGIAGHIDGSQAFRKSDHWDPGYEFPWDFYFDLIRQQFIVPPEALGVDNATFLLSIHAAYYEIKPGDEGWTADTRKGFNYWLKLLEQRKTTCEGVRQAFSQATGLE